MILFFRVGHCTRAQKCAAEKRPAAALARQRMPRNGSLQMDTAVFIRFGHVQRVQQCAGILRPEGKHTGTPSTQLLRLDKVQRRGNIQPFLQQLKQSACGSRVVNPPAGGDPSAAAKGQMSGSLCQSGNLAEHAAGSSGRHADQFLLHRGRKALRVRCFHQVSSSTGVAQRACSIIRSR